MSRLIAPYEGDIDRKQLSFLEICTKLYGAECICPSGYYASTKNGKIDRKS